MLAECEFETEHLLVKEWHSLSPSNREERELASVVAEMLTQRVTRALPASWQGDYTAERARGWIRERDDEGTTLLAVAKSSGRAVGLLLATAGESGADGGVEVRLGYLVSQEAWGRGIASELVTGFVLWCRSQPLLASIAGGVEATNAVSVRVLEKAGFKLVPDGDGLADGATRLYRLSL